MAFRWRAYDESTLNAGLVALRFFRGSGPVLLRYPIFRDFSDPPPTSLDPRMCLFALQSYNDLALDMKKQVSTIRKYIVICSPKDNIGKFRSA